MAADFIIKGRLVVDGGNMPGVRQAQQQLDGFERRALGIGARLRRMFGMLAGAAGVGVAVRGVLRLHTELEEARVGMATLLSGQTGMRMTQALQTARGLVQGLNKDAATGVGGLQDYTAALQMMMGPGLSGGATLEQLRELTRTSLAAGFAMRGSAGLQQAPMDIVQALTSGVSDRQTPIAMAALQALGTSTADFRQLSMMDKIETLTRAFGQFEEGVEAMGKTWSAQSETFLDTIRRLIRSVSRPLFDHWKDSLQRVNDWLDRNESMLESITTRWGERMVRLWDHLVDQAGTYAALVAASAVAPAVPQLMRGGPGGGLRDGLLRRIIGTGAMGVGTFRGAGGGVAGTKAVLGGLGGVLRGLGGAAMRMAGPLAIVSALFIGLKGALAEYPQVTQFAIGAGLMLLDSVGALGDSFAMLSDEGSLLNLVGAILIGTLGGLALAAQVVVRAVASLTLAVGVLFRWVGALFKAAGLVQIGRFGAARAALNQGFRPTMDGRDRDQLTEIWSGFTPTLSATLKRAEERSGEGNKVPDPPRAREKGGDTNFHGPITIEIKAERLEDPGQVARSFEMIAAKLKRNSLQARRIPSPATG